MPHFKDAENNLYWLDSGDVADWKKPDWTEITDEEAEALRPVAQVDPKDAIRAQIKQLESEQLMPRATREFMLLFMETSFTPEQLTANPGYQSVKAFDNQIKELRAQL
jgi:hypothetical protein